MSILCNLIHNMAHKEIYKLCEQYINDPQYMYDMVRGKLIILQKTDKTAVDKQDWVNPQGSLVSTSYTATHLRVIKIINVYNPSVILHQITANEVWRAITYTVGEIVESSGDPRTFWIGCQPMIGKLLTEPYMGYHGIKTHCRSDGRLREMEVWVEGEKIQNTIHHKNGNKKCEYNYKDDLLHGSETWWYPNQSLWKIGSWNKGKMDGKWQQYRENGLQISSIEYVDGRQHGLSVEWYKDKRIKVSGYYTNNRKTGTWEHYRYKDGKLRQVLHS